MAKKNKIAYRWVAWESYAGEACCVRIKLVERPKTFRLEEDRTSIDHALGYNTVLNKEDNRLFYTREAAIAGYLAGRRRQVEWAEREARKARTNYTVIHRKFKELSE